MFGIDKIDNIEKLDKYLKRKLKSRYERKSIDTENSRIKALIDGNDVRFQFKPNEELKVSAPGSSLQVIESLIPFLNKAMNNQGPIASFEAKRRDEDKPGAPALMWNINNPDFSIQELVNNRSVGENYDVENLVIRNGKNAEEYLDSEEDRAELLSFFRTYGIDPGLVDSEKAANMPEAAVYLDICDYDRIIHDTLWFRSIGCCLGDRDITEEKYSVDYLKQLTTRFGVEMKGPEVEKRILETPSYKKWKSFWHNHFSEFNREQFAELRRRIEAGENIDEFLPNCSWKDATQRKMIQSSVSQSE